LSRTCIFPSCCDPRVIPPDIPWHHDIITSFFACQHRVIVLAHQSRIRRDRRTEAPKISVRYSSLENIVYI
jgi:hypothetical protein